MNSEWLTTREKLFLLLSTSSKPLTSREIMRKLDIRREKELYEHLNHLALSLKRTEFTLIVFPPRCANCGYVFSLEKIKKPSRCPKCKSQKIIPPMFLIRSKKDV
ncbi:MAG: transcriptional regulator [Sulfolobaceae archaeon]|nr:transcriptional regulator [Sulfolobaceae archaeon]